MPATNRTPARSLRSPLWDVLRANPQYRRIWLAAFISNVGTWMEMVGMQVMVAVETRDIKMSAYLGAAQMIPVMLFGLVGGLVADRVNRRTLLVVTQILLMLCAFGVWGASLLPHAEPYLRAWVMVALGALNGSVMAFNVPAMQVLVPRLVPKSDLTRAITLNGIQFNFSRVIGPALASSILLVTSYPALFLINALTFLAMVFVVMTSPDAPAPASDGEHWRQRLEQAWSWMRRGRGPLAVLTAMILVSSLAAPITRLLAQFVVDVYGQGKDAAEHTAGILMAVHGAGATLGGLALGYVPSWYPKHHLIPVAITALGLSLTMFALCSSLALGCVITLVIGFAWIWAFNQTWAAMQVLAPDAMRGRVMSITNVVAYGSTALGILACGTIGRSLSGATLPLVGAITPAISTQVAIGSLSLLLLVGGIVMLIHRVPEVDGMTQKHRRPPGGILRAILATEHRPPRV